MIKSNYILFLIIAIILFFAGWFANDYCTKPQIVIKKEIEYKTIYKTKVDTCEQAFECANSEIYIKTEINKDVLTIFANDKCKEKRKDLILGVDINSQWKLYAGIFVAGGVASLIIINGLK